jgi:hypothetical protein
MPVGVLEVAGVATPEGVVRGLHDDGARPAGLLHDRVDFESRGDVVPDGELGRARAPGRDSRVPRDAPPWPQREPQTGLQVEERDGAVLELRADDAVGLQAETVAVEPDGPLQVVDTERDERDPRLQGRTLREVTGRLRWLLTIPQSFAVGNAEGSRRRPSRPPRRP